MAEIDIDAVLARYRDRAAAVRERGLPPVAGDERKRLIQQAETDYLDFSLIAAATWEVEGDLLVLRIPLHP
jgi:predicted ATPase